MGIIDIIKKRKEEFQNKKFATKAERLGDLRKERLKEQERARLLAQIDKEKRLMAQARHSQRQHGLAAQIGRKVKAHLEESKKNPGPGSIFLQQTGGGGNLFTGNNAPSKNNIYTQNTGHNPFDFTKKEEKPRTTVKKIIFYK